MRHDLFEVVVAEVVPAERLGDLLVVEVDLVDAVDADHRRQLGDRRRSPCRASRRPRRSRPGCSSASRPPCWRTCGSAANSRHAVTSFGVSRPMSPSRLLEARRASGRRSPRSGRPSRRAATRSAAGCGPALTACGVVLLEPALHRRLVGGAVRLVVGEHPEQGARAALLARRVGLAGAHDRRRHEVALRRGGLHDEARAEQLADQRLEDDRRWRRTPPTSRGCRSGPRPARASAARSGPPARSACATEPSKPSISSRQREVVEDQVLREAQLVHRADADRVVDHVRRGVALGGRVDVHADARARRAPTRTRGARGPSPTPGSWPGRRARCARARCSARSGGRRSRCCDRSSAPTPRWDRGTRASWTTSAPTTPAGSRRRRWRTSRPSPASGGARGRAGRRS